LSELVTWCDGLQDGGATTVSLECAEAVHGMASPALQTEASGGLRTPGWILIGLVTKNKKVFV
jgi:hypothetical protein